MTVAGILKCHRILRANWPDAPVTEDTVRLWQFAFDDCTDAQVEAAVAAYVKRGTFWPKPAELRQLLAEAAIDLSPEAMWAEVLREVSRVGYRAYPTMVNGVLTEPEGRKFSHPLIAEAVNQTGWGLICTGDAAEARKAFIFTAKAVIERERKALQLGTSAKALSASSGLTALVGEVA